MWRNAGLTVVRSYRKTEMLKNILQICSFIPKQYLKLVHQEAKEVRATCKNTIIQIKCDKANFDT